MPIASYLHQQVGRKAFTGLSVTGKPTVGTSATIDGRFIASDKRFIGKDQREYVIDAILYVKPGQDMNLDDLITYEGIDYRVIKIEVERDLVGKIDHKKCLLLRTKSV